MYKAYFERLTDNHQAILLIEELKKEFYVDVSSLPAGSAAGTWFSVEIEDDQIISIAPDVEKTQEMASEIENRMQRLKAKKTSRFKRN